MNRLLLAGHAQDRAPSGCGSRMRNLFLREPKGSGTYQVGLKRHLSKCRTDVISSKRDDSGDVATNGPAHQDPIFAF